MGGGELLEVEERTDAEGKGEDVDDGIDEVGANCAFVAEVLDSDFLRDRELGSGARDIFGSAGSEVDELEGKLIGLANGEAEKLDFASDVSSSSWLTFDPIVIGALFCGKDGLAVWEFTVECGFEGGGE